MDKDPTEAARRVRQLRAQYLDLLGSGELTLAKALLETPFPLSGCEIHKVLEATKGMGPETTKHVLQAVGVWPLTPVGKLVRSTRRRIIEELPERIK